MNKVQRSAGVVLAAALLLASPVLSALPKVHAAPVADVASSLSPSGQALPVGDLPGWHQIFSDDFATPAPLGSFPGSAYGTTWTVQRDGTSDTSGHGRYYPSKVLSVANGVLTMHLHTENGIHMVSAPAPILPGHATRVGQLYGRYAVRFRADALVGYKTAWLLWPDSGNWPYAGEIDFPEGDLNKTIHGYMHRMYGTSPSDQDYALSSATYPTWHTAVTEWTPSQLRFLLDGQLIGTSTARIPNTAMHWTLQTETALDGSVPDNVEAGDVQVDWVAAYSSTGGTLPTPSPTPAPSPSPTPAPLAVHLACSTGSANPSLSHAGWTEYLGTEVTANQALSGASVSFQVLTAAGLPVYQTVRSALSLTANSGQWVTSSWKMPATQALGAYTVTIQISGPTGAPLATSAACTGFTLS